MPEESKDSEFLQVIQTLAQIVGADNIVHRCIFCGIEKQRVFSTNIELIKKIRREKGFVCAPCAYAVVEIMETNHKVI